MVLCIDTSGLMFTMLAAFTTDVTGSYFLSTMILSIVLMVIAVAFRIPLEYTAILLLPFHLGLLACLGTDWLGLTGTLLIYLGILFGKNFFFR
jgi:hypothetical protein